MSDASAQPDPGTAALFTADATIKKKKRKEREKRERWRARFSRRDRPTAVIEDEEIYERSAIAKTLIYIYEY